MGLAMTWQNSFGGVMRGVCLIKVGHQWKGSKKVKTVKINCSCEKFGCKRR